AEEHAAAARFDLLRAQLRRLVVPRFRGEAGPGRSGRAEALGPQRDGGAERRLLGRWRRECRASGSIAGAERRGAGASAASTVAAASTIAAASTVAAGAAAGRAAAADRERRSRRGPRP